MDFEKTDSRVALKKMVLQIYVGRMQKRIRSHQLLMPLVIDSKKFSRKIYSNFFYVVNAFCAKKFERKVWSLSMER